MFLLVSVRHVGAHSDGHQHGVSIQIFINLGKTFLRMSRIRNILLTWILARLFVYLPPFISQTPEFIYWTVLIFLLIYCEWRDTENQQYFVSMRMLKLLLTGKQRGSRITRQAALSVSWENILAMVYTSSTCRLLKVCYCSHLISERYHLNACWSQGRWLVKKKICLT